MLRQLLRRNWEVLLFGFIGFLLLASLQSTDVTPEKDSPYPLIRNSVACLAFFHTKIVPITFSISMAGALAFVLLPLRNAQRRFLVDAIAIYFTIRLLTLFTFINLLIFLKTSDHALVVAQLLLFLPCLLLIWGWIYWRIDTRSLLNTGKRIFSFKLAEGATPTIYDYFLVSFTSLLSNTLSGFSGETRTARTLIFIHGIMMWDIMGLTLSRAIAMIST